VNAIGLEAFRRVLILAAHTDDEFGCAGTIARLQDCGATLRYVALSRCEESVPAGLPEDVLEHECRACGSVLGIAPELHSVLRFRVRHFPAYRQDILEHLVQVRREFQPDLVLLPSSFDTHQDHATVYAEGFRAFKGASILGYELPQNLISFENSAFIRLAEAHVVRKVAALGCYRSQQFRDYASEEFIRSLARVRGVQCGAALAEAFEVVRLII
jgi:N-acetylglucosamine malate deacetylase 1